MIYAINVVSRGTRPILDNRCLVLGHYNLMLDGLVVPSTQTLHRHMDAVFATVAALVACFRTAVLAQALQKIAQVVVALVATTMATMIANLVVLDV